MSAGRSLELFFVDGRPDGMLTAEVFNWTGHVLRAPRTQLPQALKRPEAGYTGVYLLIDDAGERLYVGEAEDLGARLREQAKTKEWWDLVVMISAAGNALHKAHIKYLESRLVEIARDVGAIRLENGNIPPRSSLNEAAVASMESFLDTLMMVLPAIRVDGFAKKTRPGLITAADNSVEEGEEFIFSRPQKGFEARAKVIAGEFVVLPGSTLAATFRGKSDNDRLAILHRSLIDQGVVSNVGGNARFEQSYVFQSQRDAAKLITGRSNSTSAQWKHAQTGQTYAEWEAAQLEQDTP